MPADYRKQHQSILGGHSGNAVGAGLTRYMHPSGSNVNVNEVVNRMVMPYTGTIRNLHVRSLLPPGVGETFTYTIMINGIASTITCQTAGAAAEVSFDIVNVEAIALGDEITLRIAVSGGGANTNHGMSLEVDR